MINDAKDDAIKRLGSDACKEAVGGDSTIDLKETLESARFAVSTDKRETSHVNVPYDGTIYLRPTNSSRVNSGRYMEMTIEPIVTPRKPMSTGSIRVKQVGNGGVHFLLIEVGNLAQHRIERAGMLADTGSSGPPL